METMNLQLEVPDTMVWKKKEFMAMVKAFAQSLIKISPKGEKNDDSEFEAFFNSLSGEYGGKDKTTDEIVEELRASRHFTEKDLSW